MNTTSINFHAFPDEILDWVETWRSRYDLDTAVIASSPTYRAVYVGKGDDVRRAITVTALEKPDQIWLKRGDLQLHAPTLFELMDRNPNRFVIHMPALTDEGIRGRSSGP